LGAVAEIAVALTAEGGLMRRRAALVSGLCVGVAALASACGGDGNSTELDLKGDKLLALGPQGFDEVDLLDRVGEWSRSGDILTAWVKVTRTEGKPDMRCLAVDTAQRIDNGDDVRLAIDPAGFR
jgi:hypothetical protein